MSHAPAPRPRFRSPAFPGHAVWVACVLAALLALGARSAALAQAEAPLEVVASIMPLADFVAQVGGPRVRVTTLVRPGQNPHAFTLRPSQVTALHRAELLVLNGLNLEFWADNVVASLDTRKVRVVRLGEQLTSLPIHVPPAHADAHGDEGEDEQGDDHGHGGIDPHVWLDPVLAMEMVVHIRDALSQLRPQWRDEFHHRARLYLSDLGELDREYRHILSPLPNRTFIAFHAGYHHLAERYGLTEVAILKGVGDTEPSAARIAEIIRTARRLKARAIFAEPQYPQRAAQLIAEEAGAGLAILDGLGQREGITYLDLMRENLNQLAAALK